MIHIIQYESIDKFLCNARVTSIISYNPHFEHEELWKGPLS